MTNATQAGENFPAGPILLIEDNLSDIELAKAALELCDARNVVVVARDGVEALEYLTDPARAQPVVMMLDLKLPRLGGLDVLRQVKHDPRLSRIPVIVLTGSREPQDRLESHQAGVDAYVVKPVEFIDYLNAISGLRKFWTAGVLAE